MLKELKGMDYTLEILRVMAKEEGLLDSKGIYEKLNSIGRLDPSYSYTAKILPRMVRAGLLNSSDKGYKLSKSLDDITVDKVLDMCDLPAEESPSYKLCYELKAAVTLTPITEFYDFS